MPDALYKTAFHLFDTKSNGVIGLEEFKGQDCLIFLIFILPYLYLTSPLAVVTKTTLYQKIPFNFDCDMVKLYFGRVSQLLYTTPQLCPLFPLLFFPSPQLPLPSPHLSESLLTQEGKRSISYNEFCQFLHDFHDE